MIAPCFVFSWSLVGLSIFSTSWSLILLWIIYVLFSISVWVHNYLSVSIILFLFISISIHFYFFLIDFKSSLYIKDINALSYICKCWLLAWGFPPILFVAPIIIEKYSIKANLLVFPFMTPGFYVLLKKKPPLPKEYFKIFSHIFLLCFYGFVFNPNWS